MNTVTGQVDTLSYRWDQNSTLRPADLDLTTFSMRREALLEVPASETYSFLLIADSGSKLWIDDKLVADTAGVKPGTEVEGTIALTGGRNVPFRLDYWRTGTAAYVSVRWKSPSIPKGVIPKCRFDLPLAQNGDP